MRAFLTHLLLSILVAGSLLTGCSTNPVTGKNEFSLVSKSQEIAIGKQQYAPMRQAQGGDYTVDAELTRYVSEIGQKLAAVSDRKLPYEFKVLNSSVPNAWALPGGKIVINRGLLTELDSEAELAAVLGHEITHAAARHGARSMSRGMLLQGAMLGAVIASQGKDYAQLAQLGAGIGAQLITQKYGRDAERESDFYGMKYMSRAGYDPEGAIELQKTFVKLSEGRQSDWLSGMFASHPPSRERVQNNIKTAATLPKGGKLERARYRSKIAHLIQSRPAYDNYDKARKALADNDLGTAAQLAKKAQQQEPREGHFYALLGDIALKRDRSQTAKRYYDQAIQRNHNFFYYYLQRGLAEKRLGQTPQSKQDLEKSVTLLPTADAYNTLGNIALQQGQRQQAKTYYAKAAADKKGTAGKSAFNALVELDLPDNPSKYVHVRAGKGKNGQLIVEVNNRAPRTVGGLVLALQVTDTKGRRKLLKRKLEGTLNANTRETISLGTFPAQYTGVQAQIVKARIINSGRVRR
ncbi:MAG TPA: peptidase M48 [Gammaproteobacteria bacterium]|nr:peptidase M48 [Gammaproteobacteria bacterium]